MLDEFREESVEPLARDGLNDPSTPWVNWGPSMKGEISPCFSGGFLFRIFDPSTKVWALYNDTFNYEMHATFVFAPGSNMEPIASLRSSTSLRQEAKNGGGEVKSRVEATVDGSELTISLVVYPMETIEYVRGEKSKLRTNFDGKALSEGYIQQELLEATRIQNEELAAIAKLTKSQDPEEVLRACKLRRVKFIDPSFPPTACSLDGGRGLITPSGWSRPESYLPSHMRNQIRLFRHTLCPSATQRGELGNSWVMSAMAAIAEYPNHIRDMFRHPTSSRETPREEAVGAHRVWLNKDGLWKSVLVDSYLPAMGRRQRYARSTHDPCEMWVSYLEKAYAKRSYSYSSITNGDPLFAIRDFTGFPTSRLDTGFSECLRNPSKRETFFKRIAQDSENGHFVLLGAPGNSDRRAAGAGYKSRGISIGYAYAVLEAHIIDAPTTPSRQKPATLRLLRLRNPWENAKEWKGRWCTSSEQWTQYPEAAAAFPNRSGEDATFILDWDEVLELFVSCGVAFNHFGYVDYRIPFQFVDLVPSLCLEINVTEPTTLTLILSQPDNKGTEREYDEYAPMMISIAGVSSTCSTPASMDDSVHSNGGFQTAVEYALIANSTADAETPSSNFVFLQGRDISVMYTFAPERSPYMILPRLLPHPRSSGSETAANTHQCVMGVLSQLPFTPHGQAHVRLRHLPAKSPAFENYLSFPNNAMDVETTFYVKRSGVNVEEKKGTVLRG